MGRHIYFYISYLMWLPIWQKSWKAATHQALAKHDNIFFLRETLSRNVFKYYCVVWSMLLTNAKEIQNHKILEVMRCA